MAEDAYTGPMKKIEIVGYDPTPNNIQFIEPRVFDLFAKMDELEQRAVALIDEVSKAVNLLTSTIRQLHEGRDWSSFAEKHGMTTVSFNCRVCGCEEAYDSKGKAAQTGWTFVNSNEANSPYPICSDCSREVRNSPPF